MGRYGWLCLGVLAVFALVPFPVSANTVVIYGLNQTPITDCSPVCPDLTTQGGEGFFGLATSQTITGIQFWTFEEPGAYVGGTLDWAIYVDSAGVHGPLAGQGTFTMESRTTAIGVALSVAGIEVTQYQNLVSISPLPVSGSLQGYFLDLWEVQPPVDHFGVFWARSSSTAMAFQLLGTDEAPSVPEPGTSWLLVCGLLPGVAGALMRRCRRSRRLEIHADCL